MTHELAAFLRRNLRNEVPHPTEDRKVRVEKVTRFHWTYKDGKNHVRVAFESMTPETIDRILPR